MSGDWQDDPRYLPSLNSPIDLIEPGFYIGGIVSRAKIVEFGIDVVVSILRNCDRQNLPDLPDGVTEIQVTLDDTDKEDPVLLHTLLDSTTREITDARSGNKNVLVHCWAGVSRSATFAMDYIMARGNITFDEAMDLMTHARYCTCPNPLFQRVLKERAAARCKKQ